VGLECCGCFEWLLGDLLCLSLLHIRIDTHGIHPALQAFKSEHKKASLEARVKYLLFYEHIIETFSC
jgi:hypothetical protein